MGAVFQTGKIAAPPDSADTDRRTSLKAITERARALLKSHHAPAGGEDIGDKHYEGGEFAPGDGAEGSPAPKKEPGKYDFIEAPGGGKAWGTIDDETAQKAGFKKGGEIRLQRGWQHPTIDRKGFGLVHMNHRHKDDYLETNFSDAQDFLAHVLQDGGEVWSHDEHPDKLIVIYRSVRAGLAVIQLRQEKGGFFTVVTGYPFLPPTKPGHKPTSAKERLKAWQEGPGGSLNPPRQTRVVGRLKNSTSGHTTGPWEQSSIQAGPAPQRLIHSNPSRKS